MAKVYAKFNMKTKQVDKLSNDRQIRQWLIRKLGKTDYHVQSQLLTKDQMLKNFGFSYIDEKDVMNLDYKKIERVPIKFEGFIIVDLADDDKPILIDGQYKISKQKGELLRWLQTSLLAANNHIKNDLTDNGIKSKQLGIKPMCSLSSNLDNSHWVDSTRINFLK